MTSATERVLTEPHEYEHAGDQEVGGEVYAVSFAGRDDYEALYAAVARSMHETGEWFEPVYWGEPFLHKPPLGYWLMALSSEALPASEEFQARFNG